MTIDELIDDSAEEEMPPPSLPKLLAALALGVRAVNGLPAPSRPGDDDDDDDEGAAAGDDDEFAYRMAFPEFSSLCHEGRTVLAGLLTESLKSIGGEDSSSLSSPNNADGDDDGREDGGADNDEDKDAPTYDFEDPLLWERAAEACDSLLERVDAYVQSVQDNDGAGTGAVASKQRQLLENAAARAREKARGGYRMMMDGIRDMEKPQITYDFAETISNSRNEPFIPPVHPDKPYSLTPLSKTLQPVQGHGLESRNGDFAGPTKIPDDVVAPDVHYPHQYEEEVRSLRYREWQLLVETDDTLGEHGLGGTLNRASGDDDDGGSSVPTAKGLWIDTESDLERLARRINNSSGHAGQESSVIRDIAVDLEAHSHRSFSGFVCLMQISLRRSPSSGESKAEEDGKTIETASDFLVDTIALHRVLSRHLAPVFANPDIVKVMHGADSDIPWLQRDFGIYVVNLFDTGRAARALPHFSSAGLAYLLGRYAGVEADKKHQLSDWRQRPLPADMMAYATSDTTYLLDIYDRVKLELESHPEPDVSVRSVLDESKKVCLIRYDKEPFKPSAYKTLINSKRGKRKRTSSLDPRHERILKELYDWRDRTARDLDESLHYVCPNSALVRIATMCPRTVGSLQKLVNPCPPLVVRCADEILGVIKRATSQKQQDVRVGTQEATAAAAANTTTKPVTSSPEKISQLRASASPFAFFKPAEGGGGATQPRASPTSGPGGGDRDLPPRPPSDRSNAGILSPVAGTEALFKQAGWMTPQSDVGAVDAPVEGQTTTEDESDGAAATGGQKKRRQLLAVDGANENYVATRYTEHSLEMASLVDEEAGGGKEKNANKRRGRTVDGLGAAREALSRDGGGTGTANESSVEHGTVVAKKSATRIRDDLASGKHGLLTLAQPNAVSGFDGGTGEGPGATKANEDGGDTANKDEVDEEEYAIPRSMREIYQISNRNRRGTKGTVAPASPAEMENALDVDNIDGAEALLASRGPNGYFGGDQAGDSSSNDGRNKRQRTKQQQQQLSSALGSKLEDASLMTDVGWIKDENEAAEIIAERIDGGDNGDADDAIPEDAQNGGAPSKSKKRGGKGGGAGQRAQVSSAQQQPPDAGAPPTFDYSRVGAIGAYGPRGAPALSNPFFAGAAVAPGTLSGQQQQGTDRKKGGSGGGAKGKNKSGGSGERIGRRDGGSKTFVYRNNQR